MTASGGVRTEEDMVYGQGGDVELKLILHHPPADRANGACVIELHGGGFVAGNPGGHYTGVFKRFAELGYLVVAPQYRLAHQGKWPAPAEDARTAVRWVIENAASLNIDPAKIAISGYSAGGHLALLTAADPELRGKLAACISYYPGHTRHDGTGGTHPVWAPGATDFSAMDTAVAITEGYPPTILLCGTEDALLDETRRAHRRLTEVGAAVEAHYLAGLDHIFDFDPALAAAATTWCHLFLERHVLKPKAADGAPAK